MFLRALHSAFILLLWGVSPLVFADSFIARIESSEGILHETEQFSTKELACNALGTYIGDPDNAVLSNDISFVSSTPDEINACNIVIFQTDGTFSSWWHFFADSVFNGDITCSETCTLVSSDVHSTYELVEENDCEEVEGQLSQAGYWPLESQDDDLPTFHCNDGCLARRSFVLGYQQLVNGVIEYWAFTEFFFVTPGQSCSGNPPLEKDDELPIPTCADGHSLAIDAQGRPYCFQVDDATGIIVETVSPVPPKSPIGPVGPVGPGIPPPGQPDQPGSSEGEPGTGGESPGEGDPTPFCSLYPWSPICLRSTVTGHECEPVPSYSGDALQVAQQIQLWKINCRAEKNLEFENEVRDSWEEQSESSIRSIISGTKLSHDDYIESIKEEFNVVTFVTNEVLLPEPAGTCPVNPTYDIFGAELEIRYDVLCTWASDYMYPVVMLIAWLSVASIIYRGVS